MTELKEELIAYIEGKENMNEKFKLKSTEGVWY